MPSLKGTNIDPRMAESPEDRSEVHEGRKKEIETLHESIARWELFKGTRTGQIVCQLADPKINSLKAKVDMPIGELRVYLNKLGLVNMTSDDIKEYRAECRGAIGVWNSIKYKSQRLEERLKELTLQEKKEEKEVGKKKEVLAKEVEKYV